MSDTEDNATDPVEELVEEFSRLPSVGRKTAQRLAYYLLKAPELAEDLARALGAVRSRVRPCSRCYNHSHQDPCEICSDPRREARLVCVVEEGQDAVAIERTRDFRGLYHVLGGALSPLDGIGPDELRIDSLVRRVEADDVQEVIVATNPTVEGEATAAYLARVLKPKGVRVSRIASGIPVGGDLEYADEVTMARALEGRREL